MFEVDTQIDRNEVIEDMARLLRYKANPRGPRRAMFFMALGPPGSGRTKLAKNLARRYGLIYISTQELITDEIAKKTKIGHDMLKTFGKSELVPDELIVNLVISRITKPDCRQHGLVLDGFPKSISQLQKLEEFKLIPNNVLVIECAEDVCEKRIIDKKNFPKRFIGLNKNRKMERFFEKCGTSIF